MTNENAWRLMYYCIEDMFENELQEQEDDNVDENGFSLFSNLNSKKQWHHCLDQIYWIYKDSFNDGCAKDIGYIFSLDDVLDTHPINILTAIFALLVAEANIYVLYDGSFPIEESNRETINVFLDKFLIRCTNAKKISLPKEMRYRKHVNIEYQIKRNKDIKHIVIFGDFVNFHNEVGMLEYMNLRVHLPAAHYLIMNYSKKDISTHDKQVLLSFGSKCSRGNVDYAGYESEDNQHAPAYGFDVCTLFETDLTMFYELKDIKPLVDKVTTVVFTDKTKEELNYPEEFYEVCNVVFSKNFNDNIINYDFKQLFV